MVLKKALPELPAQESPSEPSAAAIASASAESQTPNIAAHTGSTSPVLQQDPNFDWDTYETTDDPDPPLSRLQVSTPSPKPSTNPFRRRMMSRDSESAIPDLMSFEPDSGDGTALLQGSTSPVTTPLKPSPKISTADSASSPSQSGHGRLNSPQNLPTASSNSQLLELLSDPSSKQPEEESSQAVPQIHVSKPLPPPPPPSDVPKLDSEATQAKIKQQRNEVYQIKHIRWYDATSQQNPRLSPILIQNANGPCPLLALVNALVLSTPATIRTALVDTLQSREQVSLGLLIDAVFDELTSDRRRSHTNDLPDVTELYSFLITLHTGMNVNPQFIPPDTAAAVPMNESLPGTFEDTREMQLYGTFSIPLIHGWLPHQKEKAFQTFERSAMTYEDAQNIQFREEELRNKVTSGEISSEEQKLLDDLTTINQFFVYWPTQLTAHGLDVMDKFLQPGQMAILFRNDHFSTLYKEPRSLRLMTLVTDAGYATHDEIVWESLVDISGARSELCSGDFRSVSHAEPVGPSSYNDSTRGGEWTTVQNKNTRAKKGRQSAGNSNSNIAPKPPEKQPLKYTGTAAADSLGVGESSSTGQRSASEQEDHDLALALQLQEEEEERQRNEAAARRAHENDLSEQYLARERPFQGRDTQQGPRIPQRRSGLRNPNNTNNTNNTSTTASSVSGGDGTETPPPSYEQAAADRPFFPPSSHPASEHAPRASTTAQSQSTSAYRTPQEQQPMRAAPGINPRRMSARQSLMEQNAMPVGPPHGYQNYRRARMDPAMSLQSSDKEDKCLVM